MTSLVTGATGYIGRHLVRRLLEDGQPVRVLQRPNGRTALLDLELERAPAELGDLGALRAAMDGAEVVYHLAGSGSPATGADRYREMVEINVTGTLNVLTAAADVGVRRVVVASSAAVYGDIESDRLQEKMEPRPISPYGVTKLASEQLCRVFHKRCGLHTTALRYFNVYGSIGRDNMLIPTLIAKLQSEQAITLFGGGRQIRDFIHVDDVVEATQRAGTVDGFQVLNVGSGEGTTIHAVVERISRILNIMPRLEFARSRPGEVACAVADIAAARSGLGWEPMMDLDNGLTRTVAATTAH